MSLQPYQQRVVDERNELDILRRKLNDFLITDTFRSLPADERARMLVQAHYMERYSWVLGERISAFVTS